MTFNSAEAWYQEGSALSELRRFPEAIEAFTESLRYAPRHPVVLAARAAAFLATSDFANGFADTEAALAIDPDCEFAHRVRSKALFLTANHTEALREALEAVRLRPNGPEPLQHLFMVQRALGFRSDAWKTAHLLVQGAPDDAQSRVSLGAILLDYAQWADAEVEFRRALKLGNDNVEALNGLGIALNAQNKPAEAIELFCRGLELVPQSPVLAANLSRARKNYFAMNTIASAVFSVAVVALAGLIGPLFNLNEDQETLLIGGGVGVVLLAIGVVRWRKTRQLPPAARGLFDPYRREERRRLVHVALIPVTIFLLFLSLLCVASLAVEPSLTTAIGSAIVAGLTAWSAHGWWRTRKAPPAAVA